MPRDKDANTNTCTAARSLLPGIFITTAIAILLGVFEEVTDPFGLDTHTDLISANIYNTITSPQYGQRTRVDIDGQSYSSHRGQANIITLLVDLNPIAALPKLCWHVLPIGITTVPSMAIFLNGVKSG